ncbi:threonine/serine ThrE exporter family protein [Sciscionella sediminilitoris]|uniref:threonine/serine ThrE exporter family protein n=1 Tax=Sciscionella sediminilitoris TaxID=1445613 RepID=UPI0005679B32|nr:threonine/serine exporter family protein [Sciscionella sp. SE31]
MVPPTDRGKPERDPLAEHAVTDEHRAAAARERERSQSRTKFFTPVSDDPASNTPASRYPASNTAPSNTAAANAPASNTPVPEPPGSQASTERVTPPGRQQSRPKPERPKQERPHRRVPGLRRARQGTDSGLRPATPIADNATYGPELPGESQVQLVLDLALRIGEVKMACGAGAADTTEAIYSVTEAYGLPHCEVDVIFSSITVSVHRGSDVNPITAVRLVRARGSDYTRLEATDQLLQRIINGNGKFRPYEASTELERITKARHPYPRWVATLAWAGMAASIAILINGTPMVAVVTAVISAVIDRLGRFLNRRALPSFFQQLVGGLLATFIALVVVHFGPTLFGDNDSSLVIGAAITVLLSGLSVVQTVQDAVTGYYVTAAGRTIEIALISAGLIAGVVIAVKIATVVGITQGEMDPPKTTSVQQVPLLMLAGAAAAAFYALASYARTRTLLVSAAAGALGGAAYGALLATASSPIIASAAAAVVIGFAGGLLTRRLRIPPVIVAVAGLTPLLPGFSTYRALYGLVNSSKNPQHILEGGVNLVVAVTIALALGAGVVLGQFLAHPVRRRLGRWQRQFLSPHSAARLRRPK